VLFFYLFLFKKKLTCEAHIMPHVIFLIFFNFLKFILKFKFFSFKKKFTGQANIMSRVRISFLYSIWS